MAWEIIGTLRDTNTISVNVDLSVYKYRLRNTKTVEGQVSFYVNGIVKTFIFNRPEYTTNASIFETSGTHTLSISNSISLSEATIERELLPNGKIKDQAPGAVINFAGSVWTLLDPAKGYLFKNADIGSRAFDYMQGGRFDPMRPQSIANHLNTTWLDSIDAKSRNVIQEKSWIRDDYAETVNAKVGLISYQEFVQYKSLIQKPVSQSESTAWTISTYRHEPNTTWSIRYNDMTLVTQSTTAGAASMHPTVYINPDLYLVDGTVIYNTIPTVSLISPSNNQTLHENDILNISGEAYDANKDQSVTVFYQINSEQRKVLAINASLTQITLSKQLTFKSGKIYDGEVALTGILAEGVAHTLKVWAVDSEGGQSTTVERTFYVVPNRAPLLSVDTIIPSGIIDTDKFTISGTSGDPDANANVKVSYRINAGNAVDIYDGSGGAWEFEVFLAQLKVGENTIIVEVVDNYGAKTSKTIKLNKNTVNTPILQSVARHKISPPKGSARGVLIWVQRDEDLDLTVELSMTLAGEQEQYILLEADPENIVEVSEGIVEDEYYHETVEPKDNIILKLTTSRANVNIDNKIYLIWGVLE